MITYLIYKATNMNNGKVYIGQAENLRDRKATRRYGALSGIKTTYFDNAIRKHGWASFIFEVIEYITDDLEQLDRQEKFWIDFYQSRNREKGYNNAEGGRTNRGYKWTEEQKKNASKRQKESRAKNNYIPWNKGKKMPEFSGENHHMYGKILSEERKQRHSEMMKEKYASGEVVAWMLGKTHSEETLIKMSKAKLGVKMPEGFGENQSLKMKEKYRNGYISPMEGRRQSPKICKPIRCVETGIEYYSICDASRSLDICCPHISGVLHNRRKTAGGFTWEYVNKQHE